MKNILIFVFIVLIFSCTQKEASDEYRIKNAQLMAEIANLERENAQLSDRIDELQDSLKSLRENKPEANIFPFSENLSRNEFLFKDNITTFPFGFIELEGYYLEYTFIDSETQESEELDVFILSNRDSYLYKYFRALAEDGNQKNYYMNGDLGVYFSMENLDEELQLLIKNSTQHNLVKILGYLYKPELGSPDHNLSYFIPIISM